MDPNNNIDKNQKKTGKDFRSRFWGGKADKIQPHHDTDAAKNEEKTFVVQKNGQSDRDWKVPFMKSRIYNINFKIKK
jgi:hypothetical protein